MFYCLHRSPSEHEQLNDTSARPGNAGSSPNPAAAGAQPGSSADAHAQAQVAAAEATARAFAQSFLDALLLGDTK